MLHQRDEVVLCPSPLRDHGAWHQIELIESEAARRGVTVRIVCDIVHVLQYLWAAAWCFHDHDDPAAEDWAATRALAALAGHALQVAGTLETDAERWARPAPRPR
ncbi:hypothetical protein [Nocardia amamiensis]|uniref:hypothetical protein n=1 Tax=Nocardia amamiensis TaxID=404578 RepID=UPI000835AE2E|nr:hypothetical protein [Nocardia amamiensis]